MRYDLVRPSISRTGERSVDGIGCGNCSVTLRRCLAPRAGSRPGAGRVWKGLAVPYWKISQVVGVGCNPTSPEVLGYTPVWLVQSEPLASPPKPRTPVRPSEAGVERYTKLDLLVGEAAGGSSRVPVAAWK